MHSISIYHAERIARAFRAKILNYVHNHHVVFGLELPEDLTTDDLVLAGVELVDILGYTTGRNFTLDMEVSGRQIFFPDWKAE